MGYGFPASMGVKVGKPESTVIDIAGDGSFQMNLRNLQQLYRRISRLSWLY